MMTGCLLAVMGCGTVLTFAGGSDAPQPPFEPRPFGGVRLDAVALDKLLSLDSVAGPVLAFFFALDLPLSFAADLLTLPVTLFLWTRPGESPSAKPDDEGSSSPEERPPR
jgi:hypothetical protein